MPRPTIAMVATALCSFACSGSPAAEEPEAAAPLSGYQLLLSPTPTPRSVLGKLAKLGPAGAMPKRSRAFAASPNEADINTAFVDLAAAKDQIAAELAIRLGVCGVGATASLSDAIKTSLEVQVTKVLEAEPSEWSVVKNGPCNGQAVAGGYSGEQPVITRVYESSATARIALGREVSASARASCAGIIGADIAGTTERAQELVISSTGWNLVRTEPLAEVCRAAGSAPEEEAAERAADTVARDVFLGQHPGCTSVTESRPLQCSRCERVLPAKSSGGTWNQARGGDSHHHYAQAYSETCSGFAAGAPLTISIAGIAVTSNVSTAGAKAPILVAATINPNGAGSSEIELAGIQDPTDATSQSLVEKSWNATADDNGKINVSVDFHCQRGGGGARPTNCYPSSDGRLIIRTR